MGCTLARDPNHDKDKPKVKKNGISMKCLEI